MIVPKIEEINKAQFIEVYSMKRYPEFTQYINTTYPNDISWREKLYWWKNGINNYIICPECGRRLKFRNITLGYHKYCSRICKYKSNGPKEALKKTCLKKYGVTSYSKTKEFTQKLKNACLERYGVDSPLKNKELKEKQIKTMLERYGVERALQSKEFLEKFKHTIQSEEVQQKSYNTKKKNHSFTTSKIEQQFKQWLDYNNINYKYQYRSEKYPFNCDFYFPDKDLYLEIQGNWTHGKHPYDPNNIDDINILNIWKSKNSRYYNTVIKIWTINDPHKREIAKINNLNWVEIFTNDINDLIKQAKSLII